MSCYALICHDMPCNIMKCHDMLWYSVTYDAINRTRKSLRTFAVKNDVSVITNLTTIVKNFKTKINIFTSKLSDFELKYFVMSIALRQSQML